MKKLLFLLAPLITACGGKNSDNPKPEPTIYAKWHVNYRESISAQYKDGIIIKKDSLRVNGKPNDYWEFQQSGKYILYEQSNTTRESSFTLLGDSIFIEPGTIYPVKVSFYYKFGPGIYGGMGPMLTISNHSVSYTVTGLDSVTYSTLYDFSR